MVLIALHWFLVRANFDVKKGPKIVKSIFSDHQKTILIAHLNDFNTGYFD